MVLEELNQFDASVESNVCQQNGNFWRRNYRALRSISARKLSAIDTCYESRIKKHLETSFIEKLAEKT